MSSVNDKTLLELISKKSTSLEPKNKIAKVESIMPKYDTVDSNNWMNIRASKVQKWMGEIGHSQGFVIYSKPEYSVRAFYKILNSYAKRNINTVATIANEYAPKGDGNNPDKYVSLFLKMAKQHNLKIDRNTVLDNRYYPLLAQTFMLLESGIKEDLAWFNKVYSIYI